MSQKVKFLLLFVALALTVIITGNSSQANGFEMEMDTDNSAGITKRYINISDPHSGAYLYENVTVVGRSEITDSFQMVNIRPGLEVKDDFNIDDIFGSSSLDGEKLNQNNDNKESSVAPTSAEGQKNSEVTVVLPATIDRDSLDGADTFLLDRVFSSYSWWRLF